MHIETGDETVFLAHAVENFCAIRRCAGNHDNGWFIKIICNSASITYELLLDIIEGALFISIGSVLAKLNARILLGSNAGPKFSANPPSNRDSPSANKAGISILLPPLTETVHLVASSAAAKMAPTTSRSQVRTRLRSRRYPPATFAERCRRC